MAIQIGINWFSLGVIVATLLLVLYLDDQQETDLRNFVSLFVFVEIAIALIIFVR